MDDKLVSELQTLVLQQNEALSRLRGQAAAVNLVVRALISRDPALAEALRRTVASDPWQGEPDEHARECFQREITAILGRKE